MLFTAETLRVASRRRWPPVAPAVSDARSGVRDSGPRVVRTRPSLPRLGRHRPLQRRNGRGVRAVRQAGEGDPWPGCLSSPPPARLIFDRVRLECVDVCVLWLSMARLACGLAVCRPRGAPRLQHGAVC